MKIYIAAHSRTVAEDVSKKLQAAGFEITSSWNYKPFNIMESHTESERAEIATRDIADVDRCDCLVLLSCAEKVPGGKFVEAGYALGSGKRVVVIGRRENMLMWHPKIELYDSLEDFLSFEVKI